jgi:hypothetical protein
MNRNTLNIATLRLRVLRSMKLVYNISSYMTVALSSSPLASNKYPFNRYTFSASGNRLSNTLRIYYQGYIAYITSMNQLHINR